MFPAPNYTPAPNYFFDDIAKTLKEGELRVLLVIMRQTFGWKKEWDRISLSQLERKTGMCRDAVVNSLASLLEKRIIQKRKEGSEHNSKCWYSLVVEEPEKDEEFPEDGDESKEYSKNVYWSSSKREKHQNMTKTDDQLIDDSKNVYWSSKTTRGSRLRRPTKETNTKENICVSNAGVRACMRAEEISTTPEEHDKLVNEHGIEKTQRLYQRLSEWKKDTPKSKWKKNDYRSILRWVITAEQKSELDKKGAQSQWNNQSQKNKYLHKSTNCNLTSLDKGTRELQFLTPDSMQRMLQEYFPG